MAKLGETTVEQTDNKLIFSRIYDAPLELVYSMFSVSDNISKWWGPTTFPIKVSDMDYRVGGTWKYCMVGPNGEEAWGLATYLEIDEPRKIVWRDAFCDAAGTVNQELPQGTITITLQDTDGMTTVNIIGEYASAEEVAGLVKMGMVDGIKDTSAQLDRLLAQMQQ